MENIICNCNFVSEAEIVDTIKHQNARTADAVEMQTGASGACGRCRRAVRFLVDREISKLEITKNQDNDTGITRHTE